MDGSSRPVEMRLAKSRSARRGRAHRRQVHQRAKEHQMGINLTGAEDIERFSFSAWADVQVLALLHGWEPEGTYIEWTDPPERLGYYYNANSGQTVRASDAAGIAAALQKALVSLVDTPDQALAMDCRQLAWPARPGYGRPDDDTLRRPFLTFAGACGRERIEEVIAFCAAGGFRIS
jgi:hypothetical protein